MPDILDPLALDLNGTVLIEASAGTGKTYTITTLVARLVARGTPIESILVVTFTEAAAAELKMRIRARLAACLDPEGDDGLKDFFAGQPDAAVIRLRLQLALACFDQAAVMTIHAFCLSMLRENAFESGTYFDMELLADSPGFLRQTIMDFFGARISSLDPLFLAWLQQAGATPDSFFTEFIQVVSRPGIRTLPEQAEFRDVFDDYRALVGAAGSVLEQEFQAVSALIQDHPGLDRRSYSKRNAPAWLEKCREALSSARETTLFDMSENGDALYKFTRTRLEEKTKKGAPPAHAFFDLCEELLELDRAMAENLVSLRLAFLDHFHQALAAMKQAKSACFFDDLVNDLWAALDGDRGPALKAAVQDRYRACLIDEFQDTDPVQYRIFFRLFGRGESGRPFFMIGDPKQAIYAFRGGDIFAYLAAGTQASARFTLGTNYRSAPGLIRGLNHLFSRSPDPFGFKEIPYYPVGYPDMARDRFLEEGRPMPPLQVAFVDREGLALNTRGQITKASALEAFPGILAGDILSLLTVPGRALAGKNGSTASPAPGDMAVLVRTNAQAEAVYQALSLRGIPAFLSKTGSVYDSPQALGFFDLLSAVNAPDNPGLVKAALSGELFGRRPETLARMDTDPALADLWQERFARLHSLWNSRGVTAMLNEVFHGGQITPVPGTGCSERALTNFYHLTELVSGAALQHAISGPFLLDWYRQQLAPETREEAADELRLESDGQAVAIVTIHKSKGLEYPMVFLPFLWDRRAPGGRSGTALFHDPEAGSGLTLDLGSPEFERAASRAAAEQEAEEVRLLYVALTRASAMCRIYWAGVAGVEGTALGRLAHPEGAQEDNAMRAAIQDLARGADGGIALISPESPDAGQVYGAMAPRGRILSARRFDRQVLPSWRITSYSGLVRDDGGQAAGGDGPAYPAVTPEVDEDFSWEEGQEHLETGAGIVQEEAQSQPILLETFPKGAAAGDFFHNVLETVDFTRPDEIAPAVDAFLDRYGFARERYSDTACRAVRDILATGLGDGFGNKFRLEQIPKTGRFTELEFCFDLKQWDRDGLADLFDSDGRTRPYAERLRRMDIPDFKGFLKGFIDLVVCWQGRWYILDYKSNFLGADYGDYWGDSLDRAMVSHDYLLQFHLYLIALDRYLSLRIQDYDYTAHFGGGFYLFIRGMAPERNTGVFCHRPDSDFMARLRDLV